MKLLVTGGAGYVGSVLMPFLLMKGHEVVCYDSLRYGIDPILPLFADPAFSLVQGDVRDGAKLSEAMRDCDAIIHLASIVGAPACAKNPYESHSVNVEGTRIVNSVRSTSQLVIFSSTGSVYGKVEGGICTEDSPTTPLSDYGRQKLVGEQLFLDKGNAIVYRFATAFGLSPRLRLDLLPNEFVWRAIHDKRLVIYEANFMRTFIHTTDIARAFGLALDCADEMRDEVFNVGDDSLNTSKYNLARLIADYLDFEMVSGGGHDVDQRDYRVSYDRIQNLGFRAAVNLNDGVKEMIRAFPHVIPTNKYMNVGV